MVEKLDEAGVLFVRRFAGTNKPSNFRRMSYKALYTVYRGIDGEVWPEDVSPTFSMDDRLVPLARWAELAQLAQRCTDAVCDVVVVAPVGTNKIDLPDLTFLGYEVGCFESGYNVFSSILHECIPGRLLDLKSFGDLLNENLLFDRHADAQQLVDVREGLRAAGEDVEDDSCYPMAIFGQPRRLELVPHQ